MANRDETSTAAYVQGLWNITDETWSYKGGVPTTAKPGTSGSGMWQLGLRYDTIDLDDGAVEGGEMDTWTAGVNWYWRSNFKFMLNYVKVDSERQGLDDDRSEEHTSELQSLMRNSYAVFCMKKTI